jgi:hypothetical protein
LHLIDEALQAGPIEAGQRSQCRCGKEVNRRLGAAVELLFDGTPKIGYPKEDQRAEQRELDCSYAKNSFPAETQLHPDSRLCYAGTIFQPSERGKRLSALWKARWSSTPRVAARSDQPALDIKPDKLPKSALAADIIYIPVETPFLSAARGKIEGLTLPLNAHLLNT